MRAASWWWALLVLVLLACGVTAPAHAQTNTFTVTNTNSTGSGSLAQAVTSSNATAGTNTIRFAISGGGCSTSGPCRIRPPSTLAITRAVTIDGSTQSGWGGTPVIWLDGSQVSGTAYALDVQTSGVVIKQLTIAQWSTAGIRISGGSGSTINGCYIGKNPLGILVESTSSGNTITGNSIGYASGYSSNGYTPNTSHGIELRGSGNTVGGTTGAARNVIGGNGGNGILISGANNTVLGNYIGTDPNGSATAANASDGIAIANGATGTTIGGSSTSARNVISGNGGDGIDVSGSVSGTLIANNYIGVNSFGSGKLANSVDGIHVSGSASGVTIGGAGVGNVLSGNGGDGIDLQNTSATTVQGNTIGLNAAGSGAIANTGVGVRVDDTSGATIGGTASGDGNVISGNTSYGILLTGAGTTGAVLYGNIVGANASNSGAIANSGGGIGITNAASSNVIGGPQSGQGNVVRGNSLAGIGFVTGAAGVPLGNRISGNSIFGNAQLGIRLQNSATTPLANDGATSAAVSNRGMDYPVFTAAQLAGSYLYVTGYVGSAAGQTAFAGARVEVFKSDGDASGNGEGQIYLGALIAGSTGAFAGTFTVSGLNVGDRVTGTASDASQNTSEFSANVNITPAASVPLPGPIGEWRFEETAWNGTAGEAKDATANARDLTAYGNAATGPATGGTTGCRYGVFNGDQDRVGRSNDQSLAPTTAVTAMAWIYLKSDPKDWMTIVSKDVTYEFHLLPGGDVLWWWGGGNRELQTSGAGISTGRWVHVAITYASGAQAIYVDGVALATGSETGALDQNGAPFLIGADVSTDGVFGLIPERTFQGHIDNVRVYDRALSQTEVQDAMKLTQPCAIVSVTGFQLAESNTGLYCLDHSVTLTAIDGAGNAVSAYTGTVNLTTSTGRGTWLLQSGGGTLVDAVADDGAASYTFPGGQSSVSLWLRYRTGGAVVNVDATQSGSPSIRDTDTEGSITFSPSGFTVTSTPIAAPVTSVPAFTGAVTAGTNLPVYLTAYGQTPNDATCGVIAGYTGSKSLKFWLTRANPSTGTVSATVNASAIGVVEASAVARAVTFSSGQASVTFKYKDTGQVALGLKDDTSGNPSLPTGIRGSTGNFVSKPADFAVSNVKRTSDAFANPGTSTASGTVFTAAGRTFTATVTALDAEGSTTPNYGRETVPETAKFTTTLVLPASGAAPAVSGTAGTFTNGTATGTAFAWNEVGSMRLVPRIGDGDFLAAGDVVGTASAVVGRFVPDRFTTALNTPVFQTACTSGGYTYLGQPFTYSAPPVLTATAVALGGTTTSNYTGSLFRLTNASLGARTYASASGTLDTGGLPASSADPAIVDLGGGVAQLTYGAGTGLAYVRTTPVAPFAASITLTATVADADGVTAAAPAVFGASGGIAFSTGATQRYGRMVVASAAGSELLDLPVKTSVQYWLDAARGFTSAIDDACTTGPAITLRNWRRALATGETCVRDTGSPGTSGAGCAVAGSLARRYRPVAVGGDFNLNLSAPGAGNSGAVTVEAAAPAWLRYDWDTGVAGYENPAGLATFGVYQGPASRIYQREVY